MDLYQQYIHISKYARWNDELGRRETWDETVSRYIQWWTAKYPQFTSELEEIRAAILNLKVMPSMRALMTAGPALERDNVAGYNCAYTAVDKQRKFSEIMYILMCGTGVGFSVEKQYVDKLPEVPEEFYDTETTVIVPDSKIGWAKSLKEIIGLLYSGQIPKWDTSRVRKRGERLHTFGGRASGPEPLENLFYFLVETFRQAAGRRLTSLEVHDIVCRIADCVVVGGVRRSALISLSSDKDNAMATAKTGNWYMDAPYRSNANNSAVYDTKPTVTEFLKEWTNLYESKSGERGFFNRQAARDLAERSGRRDPSHSFGTNPCSEIILRSSQFCNLTEVVVRDTDSLENLKNKVRFATILGTLQSTLTDFRFLSSEWKRNCEEERLLGVSLTGIMDHMIMSHSIEIEDPGQLKRWLEELKQVAIETNRDWANRLGISPSTAITCVKPSGTVSQLVNSASGIHPRYASYYIRRVRETRDSPIANFLIASGVPVNDDPYNANNVVFDFPISSSDDSVTRHDMSAIEQLELWNTYAKHWCEHKPSITVYYSDEEFLEVGAWVYRHFDSLSGIAFLPRNEHIYRLAPYEEIDYDTFNTLKSTFPTELKWDVLYEMEREDMTTSSQEYACVGGACEL